MGGPLKVARTKARGVELKIASSLVQGSSKRNTPRSGQNLTLIDQAKA
jgi:hypothetical protein